MANFAFGKLANVNLMAEDNKTLQLFTTRMRQMILQYKDVKKENEELYAMVDARDQEVKQLKSQLEQAQNDYNSLKMAKMVEITDGDLESAKKRLSGLIRDINKSITLLSPVSLHLRASRMVAAMAWQLSGAGMMPSVRLKRIPDSKVSSCGISTPRMKPSFSN